MIPADRTVSGPEPDAPAAKQKHASLRLDPKLTILYTKCMLLKHTGGRGPPLSVHPELASNWKAETWTRRLLSKEGEELGENESGRQQGFNN